MMSWVATRGFAGSCEHVASGMCWGCPAPPRCATLRRRRPRIKGAAVVPRPRGKRCGRGDNRSAPTGGAEVELAEPSLAELARVIKAGTCIEASFKRGKGEVGMDEYQVRTWQGWHHHMVLSMISVWFLLGETHRGQQWTPALTLPQVRYGLSLLLLEVFCTPGIDYICRQVHRQLMRNELARFYHHRTRKCIPPLKLRREIQ